MTHSDMITRSVNVQFAGSVSEAPNYSEEHKMLRLETAIVVPRGTAQGNPTVDLQMVDAEGNKFLIMATGNIVEMIGNAVASKRIETNTN